MIHYITLKEGNVSQFISRNGQGVSVIKLLEGSVTAEVEHYEVCISVVRALGSKKTGIAKVKGWD